MAGTLRDWSVALLVILISLTCGRAWAQQKSASGKAQAQSPSAAPAKQDSEPPLPSTPKDGFTFVAGGDLLGPWRPRVQLADPVLEQVTEILKSADAGFANLEGNLFDLRSFQGYPAAESGGFEQGGIGGGPLLAAGVARDLKEMGINMVSVANNHALDWSVEGMLETLRNLDEAGVVHAGSGRNRAEARAPAILETTHGRVALIGTASTFMPMAPAGPGGDGKAPRPGLSALRNTPVTLVTENEIAVLRAIATRQGFGISADGKEVTIIPNQATFTGQTFRLSDHTGVTYEVNAEDREEILKAIRAGKQAADVAVFSIHAHETDSGGQEWDQAAAEKLAPADFLPKLFHDAVDAGADIVICHGPHYLRGIEIYKGKPIFYGLGSLFFEMGTGLMGYTWPRIWFDTALAVSKFNGGKVTEVRIYPLSLDTPANGSKPRSQMGTPRLASPADSRRILEWIQRASAPYGTQIQIENDIGVIRVSAP